MRDTRHHPRLAPPTLARPARPPAERRAGGLRGTLAATLAVLVTGFLSAAAWGQEQYELGDEDNWIRTNELEPGTAEAQLALARRALAEGDDRRAEFLATTWIDRHQNHPLEPEAYIIRGDALFARRDYYLALFDYELVARKYAGSEAFVTALEREYEIAKMFATGTKRKLWGMRILDAQEEAQELLIRIWERLPGSELAERAGLTLGDYYFEERKMSLAAEMYALIVENFPRSPQIGLARKRLIYAYLASFKGPEFDASGLYEARTRLEALKVIDPSAAQQMGADALLTRIDESDAQKLLSTAKWYLATKDTVAAEFTIRRLLRRYPRSGATARAVQMLPSLLPKLPPSVLEDAPEYESLWGADDADDTPTTDHDAHQENGNEP